MATERVRNEYEGDLPQEASDHLEAIHDLQKAVAVTRQFFKTLAIQQDLARLSRRLVYSGVVALGVLVGLTLSYTRSTAAIPAPVRPAVVTVGLAAVSLPVMVLVASMLRVATVSLYSVSAGPFVPPEERSAD